MSKGLNTCLLIALILLCCSGKIYSRSGIRRCGWQDDVCCRDNKCLNTDRLSCKEGFCRYDPTLIPAPREPKCGGNNLPCCITGPAGKPCTRGTSCIDGKCKLPAL